MNQINKIMNQPMRLFTLLTFLFCLPVFLPAQRPVSVRTDAGQGTKQEQRDPAATRPTAAETTTPTRRTPTRPAPAPTTPTTTTRSSSEAECPPGGWGQTAPRTTTRNDRPTQTSRSRTTTTTRNRPASTRPPRTTTNPNRTRTNQGDWCPPGWGQTNQRTTQRTERPPSRAQQPRDTRPAPRTTECDRRTASTRPHPADCTCQEKGKKGRGWANGHQKKANPNARALRIPSVPGQGRNIITTGGFAGSNN